MPSRTSSRTRHDTLVWLQPDAPAKPPVGAACNGCGVCCSWAPCPVGMLISRRRQGACAALVWQAEAGCYRCGLLSAPARRWPGWPRWAHAAVHRWARRWIAAGQGCDCALDACAPSAGPV